MRDKRKIRNILSGSEENSDGKVALQFFKFLMFLDRILKPKRTSGNVPDNESFGPSTEDLEESQEPKINTKRKIYKRSSDNEIDRQYLKYLKTISVRAEEKKFLRFIFPNPFDSCNGKAGTIEKFRIQW